MPLVINKDGKQLGPYSLEEARALVLSGQLDPTDWAWSDNATDWVQLKDVPGFTATPSGKPSMPPPPASVVAAAASKTAEQELWSGHPSQLLNADVYIFWALALLLTMAALGWLRYRQMMDSMMWAGIIFGIVALIGLVNIAVAYFHLRSVEYIATTQRVRVISGLFSKDIQEIELFRVKDTMARQTFLLRIFGLGTITIVSGDANHPRLVLSGVPHAIELREKIREEVAMSLSCRLV